MNEEIEQEAAIQIAKLTALRETIQALTKQQLVDDQVLIMEGDNMKAEAARIATQIAVMKAIEMIAKNIWSDERNQLAPPDVRQAQF